MLSKFWLVAVKDIIIFSATGLAASAYIAKNSAPLADPLKENFTDRANNQLPGNGYIFTPADKTSGGPSTLEYSATAPTSQP